MKFPEVSKPETLEKRYLGKLSKKAFSFMKVFLKYNNSICFFIGDRNYSDQ